MRKILIVISLIVVLMFQGCGHETTYWQNWEAPNWTSDGKIVFLEDTGEQKIDNWGAQVGGSEEITLYEINSDGSGLREIREIASCEFEAGPEIGPISTSSAGDWVVLSIEDWRRGDHYPVMYTVKRNGDSLSEIGSGRNPDFSPNASQIVYQKPNQGIWIIDRDGGNDHQIISDADARYPAWSPDDTLVAYGEYSTHIANLEGDSIREYPSWWFRDWGPLDSNIVMATNPYGLTVTIDFISEVIDTLSIFVDYESGSGYKWSPNGNTFIAYDGNWFVINRDGTNKWYLQP